ncbi:hypothetical protein J2S04_001201 [Alicyclobacillus tengchongensis]|uniref:Uncharacterized protein n=2 Tax=Alicyclobacillus tolerans TaxID=90970 RepID=A0A1M6WM54_9BACL|nr:hypothetical protein [Alicyclobacillus tengchongensis]SHK94605.1 hypothetical protein SAMN05443507_12835 [Alicyclobacillus montanus]
MTNGISSYVLSNGKKFAGLDLILYKFHIQTIRAISSYECISKYPILKELLRRLSLGYHFSELYSG